jgi:hypothetical protein
MTCKSERQSILFLLTVLSNSGDQNKNAERQINEGIIDPKGPVFGPKFCPLSPLGKMGL